jgi:hypothetical protein
MSNHRRVAGLPTFEFGGCAGTVHLSITHRATSFQTSTNAGSVQTCEMRERPDAGVRAQETLKNENWKEKAP